MLLFFLSVEGVVVFSQDFMVSLDFCFFLSRKRISTILFMLCRFCLNLQTV